MASSIIQFTYLDYQAFYICQRHAGCHSLSPDSPCLSAIYYLLFPITIQSNSPTKEAYLYPSLPAFPPPAPPPCNGVYLSVEVGRVVQQPRAYRRHSLGGAIPVAVLNTECILRSYPKQPQQPGAYRLLPDSVSHFVNCLRKWSLSPASNWTNVAPIICV